MFALFVLDDSNDNVNMVQCLHANSLLKQPEIPSSNLGLVKKIHTSKGHVAKWMNAPVSDTFFFVCVSSSSSFGVAHR